MKTRRLKRIKMDGRSHYHVMSRIAERRFYLGDYEKDMFCDMMERVALFSGIHVLTYCIMDNHFHLLIEVPEREKLSVADIKRRLPFIYRGDDLKRVLAEFTCWEQAGNVCMLEELKKQYERRMYDLSEFMKTLKQRFSIWYNRNHGDRKGTLWEDDRFISVLVQSPRRRSGDMGNLAIMTMAAYIELNAVRAGIVDDPKDYRWCGYGAASAGLSGAQAGVGLIMGFLEDKCKKWAGASREYRKHLFVQGGTRGGILQADMQDVLNKDGVLSRAEFLRQRVRSLSSGLVLGSEEFVCRVSDQNRECFSMKRKQSAFPMKGGDWNGLCTGKKS